MTDNDRYLKRLESLVEQQQDRLHRLERVKMSLDIKNIQVQNYKKLIIRQYREAAFWKLSKWVVEEIYSRFKRSDVDTHKMHTIIQKKFKKIFNKHIKRVKFSVSIDNCDSVEATNNWNVFRIYTPILKEVIIEVEKILMINNK
jgi:hypothetical protein